MSKLHIHHHERVEGHPHRWHVHLHGRSEPVVVELPEEERRGLEMTDEEIHDLLPSALQRHADENRDDTLPEEEYDDVAWDAPVRVMQTHFMA
jgi:cation transport regulator ChaB